jgi:hypothetical protein
MSESLGRLDIHYPDSEGDPQPGAWVVCWQCGGDGGRPSCVEDTCPIEGGEDCCTDPICQRTCDACAGEGGWKHPA